MYPELDGDEILLGQNTKERCEVLEILEGHITM